MRLGKPGIGVGSRRWRRREKKGSFVRSIEDPNRKKRKRNNKGKDITTRSNLIKLEGNDDGNNKTSDDAGSANNTRNSASAVFIESVLRGEK